MSLLDLITGGKSSDASGALEKAYNDIHNVKTPTADEMKYQLQKLVSAGTLTPEQAQAFLQSPNAMLGEDIDQTGTRAQQQSIGELLSAASQGGLNPQEQSQTDQILQQLRTSEKGANDAVLQNQAARGALTSGQTLAAQLQNNQNATANAHQDASNTAGQAYQQMLNELTSAGSMGSGLQGQQNTQANTVAAATNAINQFNSAQQQGVENENVSNENASRAYNLENEQGISNQNVGNENQYSQYQAQLPQEVFGDEMQKAAAEAGVSTNQASLDTQQGGQLAGLYGNLIGAGGEVAAAGMSKPPVFQTAYEGGEIHDYLNGGMVDGKASVPGNSPKNDTVQAMLSPGEIVLPRTVAQHPSPDHVMDFLNRIRSKKEAPTQIHPEDTAHVLKALSIARGRP